MFEQMDSRTSLFRSSTGHLSDSTYKPIGRKAEIEQIANATRPIVCNNSRAAVLICGEPGTGKTTCVRHVLTKLDEETKVKPVYINCWQYNTRPSLLSQLLISLGYAAPRKGKPVDELLLLVREWIRKNRSVVIALDEFDQLRDQTEIVYDLYQVSQESENDIGLLLLANRPPSEVQLDPRSESRLNYRTVHFRPYTQSELIPILENHAEEVFRRNAVYENVLERIADHVVNERNGDCRLAVELLYQAGQVADHEQSNKITPTHVEQVFPTQP